MWFSFPIFHVACNMSEGNFSTMESNILSEALKSLSIVSDTAHPLRPAADSAHNTADLSKMNTENIS